MPAIILIASFILIASIVFFAAGYNILTPKPPFSTPAYLRGDIAKIRQELLKIIPIGTPLEDAERIVESLGLENTYERFLESYGLERGMGSRELGFIACQYNGKRGFVDDTTWLITINCLDGRVTDISCDHLWFLNGIFDPDFYSIHH